MHHRRVSAPRRASNGAAADQQLEASVRRPSAASRHRRPRTDGAISCLESMATFSSRPRPSPPPGRTGDHRSSLRSPNDQQHFLEEKSRFISREAAVFAVGSWRPAPGLHCRGHAPTISAKLRKKLREMRGVFVIVVPEWYCFGRLMHADCSSSQLDDGDVSVLVCVQVDHAFMPFLPRAHVQEWVLEAKAPVHRQARFSQIDPRTWCSPLRKQAVRCFPFYLL
jgi:hypothetical protein